MNLDLSKIENVHIIGIGGIGISAIARMMINEGKKVTGQDIQEGEIVNNLRELGIDIKIEQSFENIPTNTDLIIYTIAIEYYDEKLFKKLKEQKIPAYSYPEMLGIISKDKYTIAICGTHGKTTTTAMIAKVLVGMKKDPTVVVGSLIKDDFNHNNKKWTNFIAGKSDYFVAEACEYRRSFLNINPNILIITNIEEDHLDYYKDIEDIKNAFREMAMKVPENGFVICNTNDKNISDVIKNISAKIIDYHKYFNKNLELKIPGIHNKKDAAAATAAAALLEISQNESEKFLKEFSGTWRRFEYKGKLKNGVLIYDDYAHHPTEIITTLSAFRELYKKENGWNITVVFQPHLFSRTRFFLNDFAKSFSLADKVLLLPIYFAREVDDGSISSEILATEINKYSQNAESFSDFKTLEKNLVVELLKMGEKDIIVTMGAGEAFKIGDFLLKS